MTSITIPDVLIIMYVLVDDWYQAYGKELLKGKVGKKPTFSDSEVITLMLAQDFIPYPSETQFVGFIRANHLALFPKLLDQSQFNRRARSLRLLVEQLRRYWVVEKLGHLHGNYLLDTKPVPVMGYKIGVDWQARIFDQTHNMLWTPKRSDQYVQNPKSFDRWLSTIRERIEGVFHEIQNTGRNLERLLAKTVLGINIQTFQPSF